MPYVERGEDGTLVGWTSHPFPGIPEEFLPDDDPEVVEFNSRSQPSPPQTGDQR
jgi:hypothetical protein